VGVSVRRAWPVARLIANHVTDGTDTQIVTTYERLMGRVFVFAGANAKDYSLTMALSGSCRRFARLLIAFLFAISMATHGFAVSQAATKMMAADASMQVGAPDHPMDCDGKGMSAKTACFAMCASAVAILCDSASVPFVSTMLDLTVEPQAPVLGRGVPPEPHPPKPVTLS